MGLPLLAGAVAGIGSLLGGRKRSKAAGRMEARSVIDRNDAMRIAMQDQDRALKLREADELRLRSATGYDLVKLRADAEKAGFNPLTAFQLTGGAGYDGRGAVLTSPFVSQADAFLSASGAVNASRGMVVDTAGYLGDAIGSAGSAFFNQYNQSRQLDLEAARVSLLRDELAVAARPFGGGGGVVTTGAQAPVTSSPFAAPIYPSARAQSSPQRNQDLFTLGEKIIRETGTSSAQTFTDEYGDTIGEVYGIRQWVWDKTAELKREFRAMPVFTQRILPEWSFGRNGQIPFRARVLK